MNRPETASRAEWLGARKALLAKEKEFTRQRDALNAERRRLPMVSVDKDYVFDGPDGTAGCSTCSRAAGSSSSTTSCSTRVGTRAARAARPHRQHRPSGPSARPDTSLALVSRAP